MATRLLDPFLSRLAAANAPEIDPERLADTLRITMTEVASLAGVHRGSLSRNRASPELQRRLGLIATILSRAAALGGGLDKAVLWFRHQPVAALGNARPADLLIGGEGKAVLAYLDALEHGAYA